MSVSAISSPFCVCCLATDCLRPLLDPDIGYTDILKDFFMIKMFPNERDGSDVCICEACAQRLLEAKQFKQLLMETVLILETNRLIKTRKGKGGYLFVRKIKKQVNTETTQPIYITEVLDEDLLNLDSVEISFIPEESIECEIELKSNEQENVIIKTEDDFQDIEYVIIDDSINAENMRNDVKINKIEIVDDFTKETFTDEAVLLELNSKDVTQINGNFTHANNSNVQELSEDSQHVEQLLTKEENNFLDTIEIAANKRLLEKFLSDIEIPREREKRITVKRKIKQTKPKEKKVSLYTVNKDLRCEHCQLVMVNLKMYHKHMNTHFPNHVCETCGQWFLSIQRLKRHRPSHEKGPFECNICKAIFTNYNTMNSHKQRKHKEVHLYKCTQCEERFSTFHRRMLHLSSAHGQSERKYKCHLCPMSFLVSGNLSTHIRRVHLNVKRHYCHQCDAGFYLKQDLQSHEASHTGVRAFQCNVCFKTFPRKKSLALHMRIHFDDKRFTCGECDRKFVQKITLQCHMKVHYKRKGELVYEHV